MSKYIVWVKENGVWEANGDGPLSLATAERIAREVRRECGVRTKVLPAGQDTDLQSRVYRGELEVTDADGVETMRGLQ